VLAEVRRRYAWVSTSRVAAEIAAAITARRGFALVRLGDGEGVFARVNDEDEARHAALYAANRREWATLLYGEGFDPAATGYDRLVETLMSVSAEADVVGVPYPAWLAHEYAISSTRGVPCLLNVHRWLLAHEVAPRPLLCDQAIHIELHRRGLLGPLLRRCDRLSVISSNAALPHLLRRRFGVDVDLHRIPAERYSGHVRDPEAMAGAHFPDRFEDLMARLAEPHHGRVFVIAAGTLAKFYAAEIKRHGGIALDIGSLADRWVDIASRPDHDASMTL
jgi:hypothetical protein